MTRFAKVVLANSAYAGGAQAAIKLLSFAFSVAIVRYLGADSFGQYSAVLAFGAMFVFLGDLGLSPYTVRQVARWREAQRGAEDTGKLYGNVLALRLLLSILAAALMTAVAVATGRPEAMVGAIALGSLGLIMYAVQGTSDAVLAGFERFDVSSAAKVANQAVFVAAGATALWFGFGYYGLIAANLLGIALMAYLCWKGVCSVGIRAWRPDIGAWRFLVGAGLPFGVIGLALGLSYKFDSVLLNIYRGDAETGYYNAAYSLVFSAILLSNVVNCALYPSLARQAVARADLLPSIYATALRYLLIMALPIATGGFVLADQLVPFLFGTAYLASISALQVVIWVVPLMYASEFLGYIAVVQGDEKHVARSVVVSSGLNIAANLLLVPHFGYMGAAAMTVLTESVLVGQYLWLLRGLVLKFDWNRTITRPLLASTLMIAPALMLRDLPVLINISFGALSYVMFLVLLGAVGKEEWEFLRALGSKSSIQSEALATREAEMLVSSEAGYPRSR